MESTYFGKSGAVDGSLPFLERSESGRPYPSNRHNVSADPPGMAIRAYKSATLFRNQLSLDSPGRPLRHRNYYEYIVRDGDDPDRIRLYIRENLLR